MDTIEHPLTGEKIRIAKANFSVIMNWEQANAACAALGSGWRLPSIEELKEMYKNKDAIGGFGDFEGYANSEYFSSSESPDRWDSNEEYNYTNRVWELYFFNGELHDANKNDLCLVRAVKTI
ncbi:MAG: DUF1566 domain-containing protein [Bacteroidales bacterium]